MGTRRRLDCAPCAQSTLSISLHAYTKTCFRSRSTRASSPSSPPSSPCPSATCAPRASRRAASPGGGGTPTGQCTGWDTGPRNACAPAPLDSRPGAGVAHVVWTAHEHALPDSLRRPLQAHRCHCGAHQRLCLPEQGRGLRHLPPAAIVQRSTAKVACLPIIVGGAAFASLKQGDDGAYKLKFDTTALRTHSRRSRAIG